MKRIDIWERRLFLQKKDFIAIVNSISSLQLFQILKQKVGEKEAEALVDFVNYKIKENNESNLNILATKKDVHLLKEDIHMLKEDILKLDSKIAETKTDIIKWVFSFFFAIALMILGLYFRK